MPKCMSVILNNEAMDGLAKKLTGLISIQLWVLKLTVLNLTVLKLRSLKHGNGKRFGYGYYFLLAGYMV